MFNLGNVQKLLEFEGPRRKSCRQEGFEDVHCVVWIVPIVFLRSMPVA